MSKPLAIDLFCGLGGWTEALLAEGYDVVGFDIERHEYGEHRYPGQLVLQDVRTLHGSQFKDAALIIASPPCQGYSYRAMPWKRAKALPPPDNELFDTCFRIQREACEASGHHIPLIVENVRGAQKWVGCARWSWGSFYLWGDVPALMPPIIRGRTRVDPTRHKSDGSLLAHIQTGDGLKGAHGTSGSHWTNPDERDIRVDGHKLPGFRFDGSSRSFQSASVDGTKQEGDWFAEARKGGVGGTSASYGSKSNARKMASAMIAKIPLPLARHIARVFREPPVEAAA